jgi:nitroreductase
MELICAKIIRASRELGPARILVLALIAIAATATDFKPIKLPPPQTAGGKPLMQALLERQTIRELKPDKLPDQVLANLLWAGFGINRTANAHRTAPSAMNSQELDIYVATADGVFLYAPAANELRPVSSEDVRSRAGGEASFHTAPVTLILVADLARLAKAKPDDRRFYAAFDAGTISQNLYLYCASEGLATVVHDLDRSRLIDPLKLRPEQQIILAQAVGYPLKKTVP